MKRREFIGLVGGLTATWPIRVRAQPAAMPVIGYLSGRSAAAEAPLREPFLNSLSDAGFAIGRSVAIEYRHSDGRDDPLPELASELVRRQVAVLVATDRPSALAAKAATSTIPIVFGSGDDPVGMGLVASLNKPGGNATGVYGYTTRLGAKRLGLIRDLLPNPSLIAFVHPNTAASPYQIEEMQAAASAIRQPLLVLRAATEREVDAAFSVMAEQKVSAVLYSTSLFYQIINERLVALAARYKIPASYEWREAVVAGGLMSYNANRPEYLRIMGSYTAQILKGAKPAELPVVQSSSFIFALNLKTAKALDLEIPATLLARADEVIE